MAAIAQQLLVVHAGKLSCKAGVEFWKAKIIEHCKRPGNVFVLPPLLAALIAGMFL
jgi:hypothetical protein